MACNKYILTNTGDTTINFSYRRCGDGMWQYQIDLLPEESKNIWLIDGTFSTTLSYLNELVLEDTGVFPPTITGETPTPTPILTITPTPTVTSTPTPTPTTIIPTVTTGTANPNPPYSQASITNNTISDLTGGIECGICWSLSLNPTILDSHVSATLGSPFSGTCTSLNGGTDYHVRAYYTNLNGTYYGDDVVFNSGVCFPEGTLITMSNGRYKKIEDIEYSDSLLVWNFDECHFDKAKPIWMMEPVPAEEYVTIGFSDGSELGISGNLRSTGGHRIFNIEKGEFTYAIPNQHTPIGTHTFNDNGEIVTIVSKSLVKSSTNIYNVVTDFHMNIFAGGVLTSRRLNNLYPIVDMKFVKDNRITNPHEMFPDVSYEYYEGLRLSEQPLSNEKEGITNKTISELSYAVPTSDELNKWMMNFESSKLVMELA